MIRFRKFSAVSLGCVLACVIAPLSAQTTTIRHIPAAGTATFTNSSQGFNTNGPELDPALSTDADSGNDATGRVAINRSVAKPGKVGNVLPGLEAAFVDIGLEKNGFLHVDEIVLPGVETPKRGRGGGGGRNLRPGGSPN